MFYSLYGMFDSSVVGLFTGAWAGVSGGLTCDHLLTWVSVEVGKQHVLFTAYFLPQCLLSLPCTSHFHLHSPSYSKELVMDCILLLFLCGRIHYQTNPWSRADMFVHVILVFLLMFSPLQLFFD